MSRKKLTIDNFFSKRLKVLIEDILNISQREFCEKIGISEGYLSMLLKGKRGPSARIVAGIFLHYREHLFNLLTGEEEILESIHEAAENYTISGPLSQAINSVRQIFASRDPIIIQALTVNLTVFLLAAKRSNKEKKGIDYLKEIYKEIEKTLTSVKERLTFLEEQIARGKPTGDAGDVIVDKAT